MTSEISPSDEKILARAFQQDMEMALARDWDNYPEGWVDFIFPLPGGYIPAGHTKPKLGPEQLAKAQAFAEAWKKDNL